jgi:hypothetical protein
MAVTHANNSFTAMKPARKIFTDPAFYALILLNVYFIYEYKDDPGKYTTIIWIFWCQSVLIGIFNFIDLLSTKNAEAKGFTMNDNPVDPKNSRGCYSFFFLFHYEAFHVGYFIFLIVQLHLKNVDFSFLKLALLGITANMIISFIKQKIDYKKHPPTLSTMFFLPYLRIVPMHFMILLPAFLGWQPSLVFLVLKTIFDVLGHLITTRWYWVDEEQKPQEGFI